MCNEGKSGNGSVMVWMKGRGYEEVEVFSVDYERGVIVGKIVGLEDEVVCVRSYEWGWKVSLWKVKEEWEVFEGV